MQSKIKTLIIDNPTSKIKVTLPKDAQVFDVEKPNGVYGNSFQLCYHYNKEQIAFENHTFHIIKEGEEIEDIHKLRYIGKYSAKFSSGLVFVFLQVVP